MDKRRANEWLNLKKIKLIDFEIPDYWMVVGQNNVHSLSVSSYKFVCSAPLTSLSNSSKGKKEGRKKIKEGGRKEYIFTVEPRSNAMDRF